METLKDIILSKTAVAAAIGSGLALFGSYFLYQNVKETIKIEKIASLIEIDEEAFKQANFIGKKPLLQIVSESQEIVADTIKIQEKKFIKKALQLLKQKEYLEYADILLELENFRVQKQLEALNQLREYLGVSEEIFNKNLQQINQSMLIQNQNFIDEYKEVVNNKQLQIYQKEVEDSELLKQDFLSFLCLLEEHLVNILEKNEKIFDVVIKRIVEKLPEIDIIYPCMEALAYQLFQIQTSFSIYEVKQTQKKFQNIFKENKSQNSQKLQKQLETCFAKLEKSIIDFLQVKHRNEVAKLVKK
ncbi:transmembrane protein, putative (macronuclear) [Tetrahymena thermophila SB210]|uniref:Transmembrane protein, putative n=1 Tax=Tetrahymena thermophila (strain SB210) TaxID=312017 RepID=I7M0E5_TETTS|nr:transmembrane protein, putative [Tetrahymena thermophila SB210]EAR87418.1 transmembrane protein, putative [Tetrahymena thermophila SB210]|eukprot:XP_001007663.1 transmembrane protein, putative [Tetrahymena thermophila SB210]